MSTTGCLIRAENSLDANTDEDKLFPTPAEDNILDTGSEHCLSTGLLSRQYPHGSFISIQTQGSGFRSFVNIAFAATSLTEFS